MSRRHRPVWSDNPDPILPSRKRVAPAPSATAPLAPASQPVSSAAASRSSAPPSSTSSLLASVSSFSPTSLSASLPSPSSSSPAASSCPDRRPSPPSVPLLPVDNLSSVAPSAAPIKRRRPASCAWRGCCTVVRLRRLPQDSQRRLTPAAEALARQRDLLSDQQQHKMVCGKHHMEITRLLVQQLAPNTAVLSPLPPALSASYTAAQHHAE
jgi:hypothetical protein